MSLRRNYNACLRMQIVIVLLLLWLVPASANQPATGPSTSDLEALLGVVEHPEKREAFVKNLKGLIEAKKALDEKEDKGKAVEGEPKQLLIVRWVFDRFEDVSRDAKNVAITVGDMIEEAPEGIRGMQALLLEPESRSRLLTLLWNVGIASIITLMLVILLVRPARSAMEKMTTLRTKIGWGFVYVLLKGIPYLVLCMAFILLVEVFPSLSPGRTVVLLFFGLLLFYRVAMSVFMVLFSPEEARHRIVTVSDENANYLWIWVRRFALYAFFYFMITRSFLWTESAIQYYSLLRGVLLIPFPVMLTVFILQIGREIRIRHKKGYEEGAGAAGEEIPEKDRRRLFDALIRYWPVLAAGYTWAIFLSLMFHYERGFQYLFHTTLGTGVTVLIMLLCFRLLDIVFRRFFRVKERVKQRFPGLEEKANRYVVIIRKGTAGVVTVIGAGVIGEIWGIPVSRFVASDTGGHIILRAVAILFTLAVVVSVIEVCDALSTYLLKEKKGRRQKETSQKQKTLIPVIKTAVNIGAGFVGGIIILDRLGVNTTPILAGAGIVGLAVGFGSQTLVKDLINGLFILFEESIRVGDWATVGNQGGMVESVGLRTVKLRDINGTVHVIPNSTIDSLSNYSKVFSRTVMDIGIAYREDVDEVIEILKKLGEELQNDPEYGPSILEPLEIFGLDRFEDSAVVIRTRFKTKPLKQWGIKREFYRRMKRVFDEQNIEIPFPHQTLYMGEPKKGKAPPMHIRIDKQREGVGVAPEKPSP